MSIQRHFIDGEVSFNDIVKRAGESGTCLTIVKCNSILPVPYVALKSDVFTESNCGYCGQFLNISLEENTWITMDIKFYSRGVYNFGALTLKMMDLFGIFECNKTIDCNIKVKVYPKIYNIKKIPSGGRDIYQESKDTNSANEDMFSIKDVRKYKRGDSLKRIHWKVTAKHGELYVRESDTISGEEFSVFVDMGKYNINLDRYGEVEESIIDFFVSITNYIVLKGIKTIAYMNTHNAMHFDIASKGDFNSLLEYLIFQKSDGGTGLSELIDENLHKLYRINKIGVVAGKIDEKLMECIIRVKNSGYNIVVFYPMHYSENVELAAALKLYGVECFAFDDILDRPLSKEV